MPCLAAEVSPKSEHADESKAVLEQIRRDWEFRYSKLGATRLVVEGSCVVRKGMRPVGATSFGLEVPFPANDYQYPYRCDVTIDFAKRRIRKLARFDVVDCTNFVPC